MKVLSITLILTATVYAKPDAPVAPSGRYLPAGDSTSDSFGGYPSGIGTGSGGGYPQSQDQKHVYFYASPDQSEYSRFRIYLAPNSQRNTKIIFVKAPSHGGVIPEVIAPPSLTEDKTLVYVLVKNPEQGGSITIPANVGVRQAKPEVFFIKYNNKQDAQGKVNLGVEGQRVGVKVPDVPNENIFVNTLSSGDHHNEGTNSIGGGSHSYGQISTNEDLAHGGISDNTGKYGVPSGPY